MPLSITILKSYRDVEPYIDLARVGADTERDALGFLPPNAYKQAAEQGKLFVAVNYEGKFLGHLMFGGVFPHIKENMAPRRRSWMSWSTMYRSDLI